MAVSMMFLRLLYAAYILNLMGVFSLILAALAPEPCCISSTVTLTIVFIIAKPALRRGWLFTAFYGALPYILSGQLSFADAYFESMSGYTTTGATVLCNIKRFPKSVVLESLPTGWGLGIILLLIIVLPFLGAGGSSVSLGNARSGQKQFASRIKDSAIILLRIYLSLTVIMTLLLLVAGMNLSMRSATHLPHWRQEVFYTEQQRCRVQVLH